MTEWNFWQVSVSQEKSKRPMSKHPGKPDTDVSFFRFSSSLYNSLVGHQRQALRHERRLGTHQMPPKTTVETEASRWNMLFRCFQRLSQKPPLGRASQIFLSAADTSDGNLSNCQSVLACTSWQIRQTKSTPSLL